MPTRGAYGPAGVSVTVHIYLSNLLKGANMLTKRGLIHHSIQTGGPSNDRCASAGALRQPCAPGSVSASVWGGVARASRFGTPFAGASKVTVRDRLRVQQEHKLETSPACLVEGWRSSAFPKNW
jgi:hypothetical protein